MKHHRFPCSDPGCEFCERFAAELAAAQQEQGDDELRVEENRHERWLDQIGGSA